MAWLPKKYNVSLDFESMVRDFDEHTMKTSSDMAITEDDFVADEGSFIGLDIGKEETDFFNSLIHANKVTDVAEASISVIENFLSVMEMVDLSYDSIFDSSCHLSNFKCYRIPQRRVL